MRLQFSERFKPSDDKALFQEVNSAVSKKILETERRELKDMTIAWANTVFQLAVTTEFELEVGFPLIILTMLDAIYPKRVRWREVDWRLQYKVALQNNYGVLYRIWNEVNMDKAREFRRVTSLHLEDMVEAGVRVKLDFMRQLRHWFDNRIGHAPPYDPLAKRQEFMEQSRLRGHRVKFPPFILFEKSDQLENSNSSITRTAYDNKPEYERLITYLGSTEHQTM